MVNRVVGAGVGMVPFATPSRSQSYDVLAEGALRAALADAGVDLAAVQQVYAGYVATCTATRPAGRTRCTGSA